MPWIACRADFQSPGCLPKSCWHPFLPKHNTPPATKPISSAALWSNWNGQYVVGSGLGSSPLADVLLIQNGGVLSSGGLYVGSTFYNSVLITDPGSALLLPGGPPVTLQIDGGGNNLVISNCGMMVTAGGAVEVNYPNSLLVTGPGSVWSNTATTLIGLSGAGSRLAIRNGGLMVNITRMFTIGSGAVGPASNNTLVVADPCSVLSNGPTNSPFANIGIGIIANGNSMVVSNGGAVFDHNVLVGSGGNGNTVQVVGNGSVWGNAGAVTIGAGGSGFSNNLLIADGGEVFDASGIVGSSGNSNSVEVIANGLWQNGALTIGGSGSGNSLVISGGSVSATSLIVGPGSPTCDNLVELDSGSLTVTNNGAGVLEVRGGQLILNAGVLQIDTLVITNPCASFVHTGGMLIAGSVVLNPNTFRMVSAAPQGNDVLVTWLMGPGQTNTLQATTSGPGGSYITNSFTDIFIVTNNTTVGTLTNYLDIGAATNNPSRFYRARLAP